MTQRIFRGILVLPLIAFGIQFAPAQATSAQSVTLEVVAVSKISVSGNPNALIITDAVAGGDLTSVSDNSTSYNVTTNTDNMKIVVSISAPMPGGTTLMMGMASSRGLSLGLKDISTAVTPIDVVTGITKGSDQNQAIDYVFSANADTPGFTTDSRVITLTLTN